MECLLVGTMSGPFFDHVENIFGLALPLIQFSDEPLGESTQGEVVSMRQVNWLIYLVLDEIPL